MVEDARRYEKGERRFKHVGRGDAPTFQIDSHNPKKMIGKCPESIPAGERHRLLQMAVSAPNGDRDLPVAKRLYVVYQGAIYEAQTSNWGVSYHAYPYSGKLADALIHQLRGMAAKEGYLPEFERWLALHITRHGR